MNQSLVIKLIEIKQFLTDNSTKNKVMTIRIYEINFKTLISYIRRDFKQTIKINENHNKILSKQKENAIHDYIKSLLNHELSFTFHVIFKAIESLKRVYNASFSFES